MANNQKYNQAKRLTGMRAYKSATKIADYIVLDADDIVNLSGASATVDVTLPDETASIGQYLYIRVLDVTNTVAIKASDGSTDVIASAAAKVYLLHCDGADWTKVFTADL